jgi:hypothetical protein
MGMVGMVTTNLYQWAAKHGVSHEAICELRMMMGVDPSPANTVGDGASTESGVSKRVRLESVREGTMLWRNNVGAYQDERGVWVRYGLANESKQMNQRIKSSDLIGIKPVLISPDMVGQTIGQFVAVETKKPGWSFSGTARENAQLKFIEMIIAKGGIGKFVC